MKIAIEEYRGFEISFNPDKEEFNGLSNIYDTELASKSFSAVKTKIDEYIKANNTFKPFWVVDINGEKTHVVGIRKDNRFMGEKDGNRFQISDHYEKDYFVDNPDFEVDFAKKKDIQFKINHLYAEIREIEKRISGKTLGDVKKELLA